MKYHTTLLIIVWYFQIKENEYQPEVQLSFAIMWVTLSEAPFRPQLLQSPSYPFDNIQAKGEWHLALDFTEHIPYLLANISAPYFDNQLSILCNFRKTNSSPVSTYHVTPGFMSEDTLEKPALFVLRLPTELQDKIWNCLDVDDFFSVTISSRQLRQSVEQSPCMVAHKRRYTDLLSRPWAEEPHNFRPCIRCYLIVPSSQFKIIRTEAIFIPQETTSRISERVWRTPVCPACIETDTLLAHQPDLRTEISRWREQRRAMADLINDSHFKASYRADHSMPDHYAPPRPTSQQTEQQAQIASNVILRDPPRLCINCRCWRSPGQFRKGEPVCEQGSDDITYTQILHSKLNLTCLICRIHSGELYPDADIKYLHDQHGYHEVHIGPEMSCCRICKAFTRRSNSEVANESLDPSYLQGQPPISYLTYAEHRKRQRYLMRRWLKYCPGRAARNLPSFGAEITEAIRPPYFDDILPGSSNGGCPYKMCHRTYHGELI
jgi:hypothetical protein